MIFVFGIKVMCECDKKGVLKCFFWVKMSIYQIFLSLRKRWVLVGVDNIKFSQLEQTKFVLRTTCKDYSPPVRSSSRPISAQWACQLELSHHPLSQTPSTRVSRRNCHMTVPSTTITSSPPSATLESVSCHEPQDTRVWSLITHPLWLTFYSDPSIFHPCPPRECCP